MVAYASTAVRRRVDGVEKKKDAGARGLRVGRFVGSPTATGAFVGLRVGLLVGSCVGRRVPCVGRGVGRRVGFIVVGFCVGLLVSSGSKPLSARNFRKPLAATWAIFA